MQTCRVRTPCSRGLLTRLDRPGRHLQAGIMIAVADDQQVVTPRHVAHGRGDHGPLKHSGGIAEHRIWEMVGREGQWPTRRRPD